MRAAWLLPALVIGAARPAAAQRPLAERVRAVGTGTVAFTTRSRDGTCGDGRTSFNDGLSGPRSRVYDGMLLTHAPWDTRIPPCERGPLRVTIRVVDGVATAVRAAIGPVPATADSVTDLGTVSAADAAALLRDVVRSVASPRAATDAMMPLVLVDSAPRWEVLADAARDTTRLARYRRRASDLLARAAAATLGPVPDEEDESNDAGDRREAVNALARRANRDDDPVPALIAIARDNPHRDARVAALYQLGHTGDPRPVALFTRLLGLSR
jgi:hypothetical protein